VNENIKEANGIISNRNAAIPNLPSVSNLISAAQKTR
jgi:hypothetical protein